MDIKRLLVVIATTLPLYAATGFAEQKNDINDPVLQQVIQAFSGRMPRFIDKHGKAVFIADESITRGSLMMALYEYDKAAKSSPASGSVSRKEFDELKNKLSLISSGENTSQDNNASGDIVQILNALEPNMPTLLDSTLGKSKAFSDLKKELARMKTGNYTSGDAEAYTTPDDTKNSLAVISKDMKEIKRRVDSLSIITASNDNSETLSELRKRIEHMESNTSGKTLRSADKSSNTTIDTAAATELKRSLTNAESEISALKSKVKRLENETAQLSPSASGNGYASALTKISLGLSMVAAFFIAR
jgi:chromosome segregation ATPase